MTNGLDIIIRDNIIFNYVLLLFQRKYRSEKRNMLKDIKLFNSKVSKNQLFIN